MIFVTTAREIQAAHNAGLVLTGSDSYGTPEYVGSQAQWDVYFKLTSSHV